MLKSEGSQSAICHAMGFIITLNYMSNLHHHSMTGSTSCYSMSAHRSLKPDTAFNTGLEKGGRMTLGWTRPIRHAERIWRRYWQMPSISMDRHTIATSPFSSRPGRMLRGLSPAWDKRRQLQSRCMAFFFAVNFECCALIRYDNSVLMPTVYSNPCIGISGPGS